MLRTLQLVRLVGLTALLAGTSMAPADDAPAAYRAPVTDAAAVTFGAYYYPWYSAPAKKGELGWMSRALRGRLQPRQLPKLGVYDSGDPQVIADHIAQSLRARIAFWAVSWWGPGHRTDVTLRDHILKHKDAGKLKYAVLYESTGRLGRFNQPNYSRLVSDFEYLAKTYFGHPSYLRIDGKPAVFLYLTRVYFRDRGGDALAELRKRFPKLYLVGDEVFGSRTRERYLKQWDAVTAYDVYGQSLQGRGGTSAAIEQLAKNYTAARKAAHASRRAFIPAISPGFNDRAVRRGHVGRARAFTDKKDAKEGDIFRVMIRRIAVPFADAAADRIAMVTSFNEWYEDTQIEATSGKGEPTSRDDSDSGRHYTEGQVYRDYGTLYLDILREECKQKSAQGEAEGHGVKLRGRKETELRPRGKKKAAAGAAAAWVLPGGFWVYSKGEEEFVEAIRWQRGRGR